MSDPSDDEVIIVELPRKDYKIIRQIIEERQAMNGIGKIMTRVFWFAGGLLGIVGLFEVFRRLGE